jgi:MFS transporter, DHA1 family, putative efflux transporter
MRLFRLALAVFAGFPLLLASRVLTAGLCMSTALGVSSSKRRGRAVALVTSGLTVAMVVGVPLGNRIGSVLNWRATFAMVALLGAVVPASGSACRADCRAFHGAEGHAR